jgi:voltage-gated potassium channel
VSRRLPRAVVVVALPTMSTTVALLVAYFTAPLDRPWTTGTALAMVGCLVVAGGVGGWQAWAVVRSPHPRLRAAAVLAVSFPVLILLFAVSYLLIARSYPEAFSERLDRVGSLYFTMTVFATVGFGDIAARTEQARVLVLVQMLVDLVYIGLLGRAIVEAARIGAQRRGRGD